MVHVTAFFWHLGNQLVISRVVLQDKNPDNPTAHEEFVSINRAFEVLKDHETRKKYDQYGEAGLKEDFNAGQQFHSWHHYNTVCLFVYHGTLFGSNWCETLRT